RQRAAGLHRQRAGFDGRRALLGLARTFRGTRRDGLPLVPAEQRHSVRERAGARREPAHVQASAARGGCRFAVARAGAWRLPGRGGARRARAFQPQTRHRAHRQHFGDLRRHQCLHRADPHQHLHAQDTVGFVQRAQPGAGQTTRWQGPQHRGHLAIHPGARGLGAAPRGAERRREGRVPHRLRDRPALGGGAGRGPRAARLPGPVAEPLPAQRHPQVGPADAALDGLGARREVAVLLPQQERAARRVRRGRSRQHAQLAEEGSFTARCRTRAEVRRMSRLPVGISMPANPQIELLATPGLLTPSRSYKPFRYPWAIEYWRRQQQIHWMPEEIPLGEDCKDWNNRITDAERNLLTQVFRFFTQSDVEVQDNYMERYARVFRPTEIKMMLAAFANMETVHIAAYALLLETLGMPDSEFVAFLDYAAMRDKHDYLQTFGVDNEADILRTLAMFGGFAEGLQLFASFAILLNFPRHNKMRGMGQVVSWSVRDETLHCEGIIRLFHSFAQETGALTDTVRDDIVACARQVVTLEDSFVDLAFEMGPVEGL